MITIFTCPKGFDIPHTAIIQRNAFAALAALDIPRQILVFGNDPGVAETAREFGFQHISEVAVNEMGTPRLDDIFSRADALADYPLLCYVNSDIIFRNDFSRGIAALAEAVGDRKFLAVGRRWNIDIDTEIPPGAELDRVLATAERGAFTALDYFVYRRGFLRSMPPFLIGRWGWDNWLANQPRVQGVPLIDLSAELRCYHQNHEYRQRMENGEILRTVEDTLRGPESRWNLDLCGPQMQKNTLHDASLKLVGGKLCKRLTGSWRWKCDCFKVYATKTPLRKFFLRPWSVLLNRTVSTLWRLRYHENFF